MSTRTRAASDAALALARALTLDAIAARGGLSTADLLARFFDLFAGDREGRHRLFARASTSRRIGTDKVNAIINCHLPPGASARPGMGPFSRHRPAQRHGRARGRRARQHARRAPGDRERRRTAPRVQALLGDARHRRQAGPEGGRHVPRGRATGGSRRSGSWHQSRSSACPTPTACARRSPRCPFVVVSDVIADTDTTRAGACAAARHRLGREGRHGHQFRAPHQPPARRSCRRRARRGPTGGSSATSQRAWATRRRSPSRRRPTSSANTRRCRPSRTRARAISTSARWLT